MILLARNSTYNNFFAVTWIFKYLWVLILLPKEVQFFCLLIYSIVLFTKNKIINTFTIKMFICFLLVWIFAILYQFITEKIDLERILATFNTFGIWVISLVIYGIISNMKLSPDIFLKISKYMWINLFILFFIYLAYLFLNIETISILGYKWYLRRMDYISSGVTTRFCGFMETVLGPSHFYCIAFPISIFYSRRKIGTILTISLGFLFYLPIFATHSRIGMVICLLVLIVSSIYLLLTSQRKYGMIIQQIIYLFLICVVIIALIFVLCNFDIVLSTITNFWSLRGGSNDARFNIYKNSLNKFITESPFIGIGIKYMIGDFPLGSHSTYIGILYKTGIIGSIFFIILFLSIFKNIYKNIKHTPHYVTLFSSFVLYCFFLIFADIDSCNWIIVIYFSFWGILQNISFREIVV